MSQSALHRSEYRLQPSRSTSGRSAYGHVQPVHVGLRVYHLFYAGTHVLIRRIYVSEPAAISRTPFVAVRCCEQMRQMLSKHIILTPYEYS